MAREGTMVTVEFQSSPSPAAAMSDSSCIGTGLQTYVLTFENNWGDFQFSL